jgi:VanZ family protein
LPARPFAHRLGQWVLGPPTALRVAGAAGALVLTAAVLGLGAQPGAVGLVADGWDKLAHAALHFVLAWLLLFATGLRRGVWVLLGCTAFAVLDEFAQQFNPGRSISAADVASSVAGAVLALACARAFAWAGELRSARRRLRTRALVARWREATRR